MTDIFNEFDNAFLNDDFLADIENAQNGTQTERAEVPAGRYEVKIQKMELTKSKKGDPMFSCWFKIVGQNSEYKNQMIFMNQLVTKGFQVHLVNEFLRSLKSKQEVVFVSYKQWGQLIADVFNDINGRLEYGLNYSENAKGYKEFKIFAEFEVSPF